MFHVTSLSQVSHTGWSINLTHKGLRDFPFKAPGLSLLADLWLGVSGVIPHLQGTPMTVLPTPEPLGPFPDESIILVPSSAWVLQPRLRKPSGCCADLELCLPSSLKLQGGLAD